MIESSTTTRMDSLRDTLIVREEARERLERGIKAILADRSADPAARREAVRPMRIEERKLNQELEGLRQRFADACEPEVSCP